MDKHHHHHHAHHAHHETYSYKNWLIAIFLIFGFAVVEAISGWFANSLALMSDAGHMTSDGFALVIAAFATWIARKPPSKQHSYGLGRAEILAAWFSSLLLFAIAVMIIVEAISRIHHPPQTINGISVICIATLGILTNLIVAWILSRNERTLNLRAALSHVLSDLLASFAALISGSVIYATHWLMIDPVLSILIGIIIMISSIRLLRESMLVLMEGVPLHINLSQVENIMQGVHGVSSIHDLHVWTLSSGKIALSAHIGIHDLGQWKNVLSNLKKKLISECSIQHITLQPEPEIMDCQPCDGKQ